MIKIINITIVSLLFVASIHAAATIKVINETTFGVEDKDYYWDYNIFNSVLIDPDTILITSADGVWANIGKDRNWLKLIECNTDLYSIENNKSKDRLLHFRYPPWGIIRTDGDIIIGDAFYLNLFKLVKDKGNYSAIEWDNGTRKFYKDKRDGESIANICLCDNLLLFGLYLPNDGNKFVVVQKTDKKPSQYFKRIFTCPDSLRQVLKSNGIKYPHSLPAYNPHDNTIWCSVWGYEYILIIDTSGQLLDSVRIFGSDYIKPQQQVSRINSQAVWRDWLSRWTPIRKFNYIPPGYFILQYRTGFEEIENDTVPVFSTVAWDFNRHPIKININKHWQVAGVHPDGRIIFAHYSIGAESKNIKIYLTKLIP